MSEFSVLGKAPMNVKGLGSRRASTYENLLVCRCKRCSFVDKSALYWLPIHVKPLLDVKELTLSPAVPELCRKVPLTLLSIGRQWVEVCLF